MINFKYNGKGFKDRTSKQPAYAREFLLRLYRDMLRIRKIECEIERRYPEDQMKTPIHLMIGQEAPPVGLCAAMDKEDLLWSHHRTHGNYLGKGGDLKSMLAEMYCRKTGCAGSRGGSMHLFDKSVGMAGSSAIVGGILPIATGAALAMQLKQKLKAPSEKNVNAVVFGDAAMEEGATLESLNFAALKKLPLIFFCENNFYSVCTPLHFRQPSIEIWKKAESFGIRSFSIDGTNVLDVFETSKDAVELAKHGAGPVFIEAKVCRYRAHAGAGDDSATGYRSVHEPQDWVDEADPIESFGNYLGEMDFLNSTLKEDMEKEIDREIQEAFEYAINSPNPDESDLLTHVYCEEART